MVLLASVSNRLQPVGLLQLISTALLKLLRSTSSPVLNSSVYGSMQQPLLSNVMVVAAWRYYKACWVHIGALFNSCCGSMCIWAVKLHSEVLCVHHMVYLGPYTKKRTARAHAVWRSRSATSRLLADFELSQLINRQVVGIIFRTMQAYVFKEFWSWLESANHKPAFGGLWQDTWAYLQRMQICG